MEKNAGYSFKRRFRVRKKEDFQKVYKTGKSFVDFASVFYVFPTGGEQTRIGVAAGKKIGNAVARNYIKRQMREVFRHNISKFLPGFDILWVARRPLKDAPRRVFEKSFAKFCQKAGLFRQS